jgi:hypothetical protein
MIVKTCSMLVVISSSRTFEHTFNQYYGQRRRVNRQASSDRVFGASASRSCRMFKPELLESNLRLKIRAARPSSGLTAMQLGDSTSLLDKAAFGCLECDLR